MSTSVRDKIAKAIREADSSYFFEDYSKQADAVLAFLRKEKLLVVPIQPTEEMVESGKDAIQKGSYRPNDLVTDIYKSMALKFKG